MFYVNSGTFKGIGAVLFTWLFGYMVMGYMVFWCSNEDGAAMHALLHFFYLIFDDFTAGFESSFVGYAALGCQRFYDVCFVKNYWD